MKKLTLMAVAIAMVAIPALARDVIVPTELAPSDDARAALANTFLDYRLVDIDLDRAIEAARGDGALSVVLGQHQIDLQLELNNLRSEGYRRYATLDDGVTLVELDIPPVSTYKGAVVGQPDSIVRLAIRENRFRGYIKTENDWLWFDPLGDHLRGADPGHIVIYRAEDVISDPDNAKCGYTDALRAPADLGIDLDALAAAPRPEAGVREWEVATEADGEWENRFGMQGGLDEAEDIVNDVDGIYTAELDLTVNIAFQHIWTNANTDPFVGNDAGNNLDDLVDYWNDPPPGIRRNHPRRDMVHHFSGKNFNFGVVGIAYLDVVCRFNNTPSNLSFGISQDFGTNNQQIQLTAHEMGHNWGSNHLDDSPCNQVCNGNDQIMCSFIQSNPNLTFATCSEDQINGHVAAFGNLCLNP